MKSMRILEVIQHDQDHVEVIFVNKKGREISYEVYLGTDGKHGMCRNGEDYAGIWVDSRNRLLDYDMVFELSPSAIVALRKAKVIVPREFEPDGVFELVMIKK